MPIASFSLQDKLIFFPVFLHNLWNLVLDTRRNSVVRGGSGVSSGGGSVPLITVICRGMRPTPEERDEIVPLLAVFAALFGYLLVTIHDTEFYGLRSDQRRGTLGMMYTVGSRPICLVIGYQTNFPSRALQSLILLCYPFRKIKL